MYFLRKRFPKYISDYWIKESAPEDSDTLQGGSGATGGIFFFGTTHCSTQNMAFKQYLKTPVLPLQYLSG